MRVWTVAFAVLALICVGGLAFAWIKKVQGDNERMAGEITPGREYVPVDDGRKNIGETQSVDLVKRALEARDEEEVRRMIDTGAVSAADVVAFLANLKENDGETVRYDWTPRLDTTRTDVVGVVVTFKKEGKNRNRIALLAPDDHGTWKMDFPAFARLATPAWKELLENRADSAVVRVFVVADQYYNGEYQENKGWRCYGLASPDVEDPVFGYCQADSAQNRALKEILRDAKKNARATVEIARTEGGDKRQFEIKRVLAMDWIVGKKDLEEEMK